MIDKMKSFSVDMEVKEISSSDDMIVLEGWANRFLDETGNIIKDRDGESVFPMGIDTEEYTRNPIILYQHDMRAPVGKAVTVDVNEKGVYVKCEIYKDLNPVAFAAAKLGVINSFSIGFKTLEDTWDDARKLWLLVKTKLFEISLVSIPANQYSQFTVVKSADGTPRIAIKETEENVLVKEYVEQLTALTAELKEIKELIKEKSGEVGETTDNGEVEEKVIEPEPKGEETVIEPEPKGEETTTPEQKEAPSLEEQLGIVLSQVTAENFDAVYSFHGELTAQLNNLVNSALTQSQN
jgi:HK97 family phage prohead protease